MEPVWNLFPNLAQAVKMSHDLQGMVGTGHDFDHALQVAQVATLIAEDDDIGWFAGAAGLCHNADRLLQKELKLGKKEIPDCDRLVGVMVREWLVTERFRGSEIDKILDAVLHHSEKNKEEDGPVLITLMDADRIVCSNADGIMGTAAFWKELPMLDPKWLQNDPTAHNYKNPKSALKNLECRYDWVNPASGFCVRLPKAMPMMESRVAYMREYAARIQREREEMGLWPDYPTL